MAPWGKRRKGKQGTGRTTPVPDPTPPPPPEGVAEEKEDGTKEENEKKEESEDAKEDETPADEEPPKQHHPHAPRHHHSEEDSSLVLTASAKRGIYECDYCHTDISQHPRIRCAVCSDFDLCLDCFATTDHTAAMMRIQAAATAHSELANDGITSTNLVPGLAAAATHDGTHGYRVCDSTRYPLFALTRHVHMQSQSNSTNNANNTASGDLAEMTSSSSTKDAGTEDNNSSAPDNCSTTEEVTDKMEVESETGTKKGTKSDVVDTLPEEAESTTVVVSEDLKAVWTTEEDLRLLDAILTHGLGNWADVAEAVGGNGSFGKTPKRCMERYFDDFLGRYGHVLPPYTIVDDDETTLDASQEQAEDEGEEDEIRASKRRHALLMRSPSNISASSNAQRARKRFKVVPTDSLPGYDNIWPNGYVPAIGVEVGRQVGRDLACKAELAFVKATASAATKAEADLIRKEWVETKLGQIGSPTVLPPRPEDTAHLPGAELAGFMPRRGDFDIEWENDAEQALADMEFSQGDLPQDKQLKLQVLDIYYQKQEEREKRKNFILSRNLYDYRKTLEEEQQMPTDERDLVRRMRLFERLHSPQEHKQFLADILKAKQLRKEIAKLQMYRRIGIQSLAEAEKYELDKNRRQSHKLAQLQKEVEAKSRGATVIPAPTEQQQPAAPTVTTQHAAESGDSLWKQYRTSDRKGRRSINRTGSGIGEERLEVKFAKGNTSAETETDQPKEHSKSGETPSEDQPATTEESNKKSGASDEAPAPVPSKDLEKYSDKEKETEAGKSTEGLSGGEKETEAGEKSAGGCEDKMDVEKTEGEEATQPLDRYGKKQEADNVMEVDKMEEETEENDFTITRSKGYDLLTTKEAALCTRTHLYPSQYLEIKKALIQESLMRGLLDKEGPGSGRRIIVKIDVERRGTIVDFMVRAGWISTKLAKAAHSLALTISAAE
jgi:hypothetical protein